MSAVAGPSNPQVARSRAAVLDAVTRIIEEEGAAAVTHQRVAERAGVGRATVYRHWPERLDLLTDALALADLRFLEPGPGTFSERVRSVSCRASAPTSRTPSKRRSPRAS